MKDVGGVKETMSSARSESVHQYQMKDKQQTIENALPEKIFSERDSLLTELYKHKHIRSIYHFFLAICFGLIISSALNDLFGQDSDKSVFLLIQRSFGKIHVALLLWFLQLSSTFVAFGCFNFWARIRCLLIPNSLIIKAWDRFWVISLISYYILSFYLLAKAVVDLNISAASAALILIDGTRLLMKIHAFVRSNAPEVLKYKPHTENKLQRKQFNKFLYFLFAPVLLYRDEYPRTKNIRWWYVAQCAIEVLAEIFLCGFICQRFLVASFADFGLRKYSWTEIILKCFANVPAGMLSALTLFYCVLHSWQNGFAELLRFGDRLFYKDWWTSTTYGRFYKTWNVVVHDWLYTYIYKDMHDHVLPKNKIIARFTVLFISAAIHEFLLSFILGEFMPILFIQFFVLGFFFSLMRFPENSVWNILFLYSHSLGWCIQLCFYAIEKHARINSPKANQTAEDFLTPRMLTCDCFE